MIIMLCVPLLVLAILAKKEIIGEHFTHPLALVIIIVGGYFLLRQIADLWWRDNMNYDEYDWDFDPADHHPSVYEYDLHQIDQSQLGDSMKQDLDSVESDLKRDLPLLHCGWRPSHQI